MAGTRAQRRKSKSKALAVVPNEPEPLNVINAEASDGPYGELQKIDDLNNKSVLDSVDEHENEYVATDEMYDEEEGSVFAIDNMIVEGNETFYTTEVTDDVDNGNEGANEEEMEEEEEEEEEPVSCGSENEDVHVEEEEEPEEDARQGDSDAVGTNVNVENDNDRSNEETEEEEEEDEEPVSCGSDNEDVHSDEEGEEEEEEEEEPEEDMSDGGDIAANVDVDNDKANEETEEDEEPVSRGSDNEDLRTGEEEDEEGRAATELVLVGNLSETRDNDRKVNELTTEKPINAPAENEAHETASTANGVKIVAEKDGPPKKKIIRRRLIKKKIPPGKAVAGKDEDQMQTLNGNEGASDEAKPRNLHNLEDNDGNLKNEEKKERIPTVKVIRKRVRNRKKRPQVQSEKPKPTNDEPLSRVNESIEQKIANEGAESDRKNKKVQVEGTQKVNAKEDIDKPGSSKSGKSSKKVESQGMIFICSSDTKKDCYRYKVFGLPAAKKDVVSRIYKGMRLFLFDVDLRMLYGVYKAASPGSYNVEPKAFKSRYPSQVRFTVLEDGLPVPEAKFRKVIKDNYYTNSKFDCHLNSEQVRNLCKLFRETRKSESNRGHRGVQSQLPFTSRPSRVNRKRKRVDDVRRVEGRAISSRDRERLRKRPEEVEHTRIVRDREEPRRALVVRGRDEMRRASDVRSREESRRVSAVRRREGMRHVDVGRSREEVRRAPLDIEERYRHPVVIYDGEEYLPPVESSALYQSLRAEDPARSRIYSYERPRGIDTYRRDSGVIYRDIGISGSRESMHHAEQIARDPYTTYREPLVYREPAYETDTRRERRSYSPAEGRYASDYQRPDDYYSPLTLHRRY